VITELGLSASSFAVEQSRHGFFTQDDNLIVTPTRWSRDRIIEFGFPAEKVRIVPCGVDNTIFNPLSPSERTANRENLGFREDECVFANVGGAFWNKGVDLVLRAFARLRSDGRKVRLILKDQRALYGIAVEQTIREVGKDCPELLRPDTLAAISVISGNLTRPQLRTLYCVCDCYVSPYRAEGFNLPVLEAIACGTPVIVTKGGATDDFCPDGVAMRVPGRLCSRDDLLPGSDARYIEPDLEGLIDAMERVVAGRISGELGRSEARARVVDAFSWRRAAGQLARLASGRDVETIPDEPRATGPAREVSGQKIDQADILGLIGLLRPWAMSASEKVRIGGRFDGGYVLPSISLNCDAVVSIGVGLDVSFDLHFGNLGAQVLQFDHTVEHSPISHQNLTFHKLGWGVGNDETHLSFAGICARLLPFGARHPLLKFDIEGAEYDVFPTVDEKDLAQFEVITCEIHDLHRLEDAAFFRKVRCVLEKLTSHHVAVHLHANNYAGIAAVHGVPIPQVLEITFLRRDLDSFPHLSLEPIPGPLDGPNHPFRPDIRMNPF